jgi:hypothetical protein
VEKELEAAIQSTRSELDSLKSKYLDDLNSYKLGYERKLQEIIWMEYFSKYQQDKMNPASYIDLYFVHLRMQEDFLNSLTTPDEKELSVGDFKPIRQSSM